jgi:hypothetical protein
MNAHPLGHEVRLYQRDEFQSSQVSCANERPTSSDSLKRPRTFRRTLPLVASSVDEFSFRR